MCFLFAVEHRPPGGRDWRLGSQIEQTKAGFAYMRRPMEETRQAASLSGSYFIVWGIVAALRWVATWTRIVQIRVVSPFAAWTVCLALGGGAT